MPQNGCSWACLQIIFQNGNRTRLSGIAWHFVGASLPLGLVAVQLISEHVFSRWLVPSIVVPIGFFYTVFRLWQLLDGFTNLLLFGLALVGFVGVVLFWTANLAMLIMMVIPKVYQGQRFQE